MLYINVGQASSRVQDINVIGPVRDIEMTVANNGSSGSKRTLQHKPVSETHLLSEIVADADETRLVSAEGAELDTLLTLSKNMTCCHLL